MADTQKDKESRTRRKDEAYDSARTGDDPSFVAVNTLPTKEATTTTERITPGMTGEDRARSRAETEHSPATDKPLTEKIGEKLHETKEDVKEAVGAKPETDEERRRRMATGATMAGVSRRTTQSTGATKDVDWDRIQHPGMEPCDEPYGTRPVSELTPPSVVQDKADLAAIRMMDRDREERDRLERERTAATGMTTAAVTRAATSRTEPKAGERTTAGAAVGTGASRVHAEEPSTHPDWETQPQINAPQDVGVPTVEGQADAARLRAGERSSDVAKEPRIDRRGGEYDVPLASGARSDVKDGRSMTEKMKDEAYKVKEETKMKAHDVKEDIDRKI